MNKKVSPLERLRFSTRVISRILVLKKQERVAFPLEEPLRVGAASLHIEFPAEADPLEAHDIIDNIERDFLKKDNLQVTIHYDPIVTSDAKVGVLRTRLTEHLRQLDPQLSIHDLRIVPGDTHTNVLFDLAFPAGYTGDTDAVMAEMCRFVTGQDPNYSCIIKLEQSYAAVPQSPK